MKQHDRSLWFGIMQISGPRPKDVMLVVAKGPFFIQINGRKWVLFCHFCSCILLPAPTSQHVGFSLSSYLKGTGFLPIFAVTLFINLLLP